MTEGRDLMSNRVAGFIDPEHPYRKYYYCENCGKPFWKEDAFRKRFCGDECRKEAFKREHPKKIKPPKPKAIKTCEWCGDKYETSNPRQKYCSRECCRFGANRMKREQWADAYKPRTFKCKECGTEFTTECGNKHSVFCCQSCADKYERRNEHSTQRHKNYMKEIKRQRSRQIIRQAHGTVSYEKIFVRDKGICQICGMPVHPVKNIDKNWDGTVDHIIPLSEGGMHSMSNCQLAHRICNSLKCKERGEYSIDWSEKSEENNYWRVKFEQYEELMEA